MHEFPANPKNGTVYEVQPGLYFVYESATHSWIKVAGSGQLFPLATPVANGIMAAADLRKINRVLMPMPSSTITGENCQGRFISGHIGLYSTDDFIKVTGEPLIKNHGVGGNYPFRITQNTAGFDFTLDKQALIQELIARGRINLVGPQGKRGQRGLTGNPGGALPTGPKGEKGEKGASPPCSVTITPDPAPAQVKDGTNKAIVGLQTEQVSDTEFNIIAKRGVVGNPDATPTTVNARCGDDSTWVLAMPTGGPGPQSVYYVDMTTIVASIKEKFESELQRLKKGHEDIVQFWLEKMSALFYAQKASLCCALTKCESLNASQPQQIAGTVAISSIGEVVRTQEQATSTTTTSTTSPPTPLLGDFAGIASELPPEPVDYTLMVSGLANIGSSKVAATLELPAGIYVAEIVDCCINISDEYRGDVNLTYDTSDGPQTIQFVRPGKFNVLKLAKQSYEGLTVEFNHLGGEVSAYLASSLLHESGGAVTLRFTKKAQPKVFSAIGTDLVPGSLSCTITAEKLAEYEAAWLKGQCCGLVMRLAGQDFIVVKRSVRDDLSCGGGEDPTFDCLLKFQILYGHPAIAWPTFDGRTFVKINRTAFVFKIDQAMSELAAQNLRGNLYVSPKGSDTGSVPEEAVNDVWISRSQRGLLRQFSNIIFPIL